jgi:energy-coupling factor transport system ATP-binding protein
VPDPILRISGLSYSYPEARSPTLTAIDLDVAPGEFVVLAGRSGSGKSTLLRACCGLVPHFHGGEFAGGVEVDSLDTREHGPSELAGHVGFVSQDPETQTVATTVAAEIELPMELRGATASSRGRAVEEVALALAIGDLLGRQTDTLSGGELQRVAIAAALAPRPSLILLDEPTSQLDPVSGDELVWLLRRLNEEWGVTIVLCEHRLERCLPAADRVVAMDGGRISFDGEPAQFLGWALESDPALSTPVARMFELAGRSERPTGVRAAREALA